MRASSSVILLIASACVQVTVLEKPDLEVDVPGVTDPSDDTNDGATTDTTDDDDDDGAQDTDDATGDDTDSGADDTDVAPGPTPLQSNSWPSADAQDVPANLQNGTVATGFSAGQTAPDFVLQDQFGDSLRLYQFYGSFVLLDVFAEWCGPCNAYAPHGETIFNNLQSQGFVVIGAMQERTNGGAPNASSAAGWASAHGLTHPVVADPQKVNGPYVTLGYPTYPLLAPDMTVLIEDVWPPDEAVIQQAINQWNTANPNF
ncbi:MAG: TlpA family protein disulfide reductase [Myxococcota bacterium]